MTVYYVDSVNGSDKSAGNSMQSAFRSVEKINSIQLHPGDTVLFAKGSHFSTTLVVKTSGTIQNPISFGSYGAGLPPVFQGVGKGISSASTSNINIEDLRFQNTGDASIYVVNGSNWNIKNISAIGTGYSTGVGGVQWKQGVGLLLQSSAFSGIHGDAVYVTGGGDININNNVVSGLIGQTSDGIQITDASKVSLINNKIDMTSSSGSQKGAIVVNRGDGTLIYGNNLQGGSYGISVTSNNVMISNNVISDATKFAWSAGILIGEAWASKDYQILGNTISNSNWGISITSVSGISPVRQNINMTDNKFVNMANYGIKIDRTTTATAYKNVFTNSKEVYISSGALLSSSLTGQLNADYARTTAVLSESLSGASPVYLQGDSLHATNDTYLLSSSKTIAVGNILNNDIDIAGQNVRVANINGVSLKNHQDPFAGKYGSLSIRDDGSFSYIPDSHSDRLRTFSGGGTLNDSFQYKISDGHAVDTGYLNVGINSSLISVIVGKN